MDNTPDIKEESNDLQLLLLKIRSKYPSLTDAAKRVADYLLTSYNEALYLNISELAREIGVSESTITKFIKTIGYNGFQELKICLARTSGATQSDNVIYGEISLDDNIETICTNVFYNNIEALNNSLRILDYENINRVADLILKARKIDFYGMGSSTIATLNAKMRFYRLGILCFTYNDAHEQIVSASLLKEGDIAVGVSNSGKTADVVRALKIAKQAGASTICITNYDDTPITRYADIKLFTATKDSEELRESINSRIAEISLIDAIYVVAASKMKKQAIKMLHKTAQVLKNQNDLKSSSL
jgi:DNA-binding MurR/RpiR family transcriptional regulator